MSKLLPLRDYQTQCIQALHKRWDGGDNRVASVLATGLGKTVIFSHLGVDFLQRNTGKRVLVIAHTNELIEQAARSMRKVAPHLPVGIVKAELNQCTAQVVVSSRQTLASEHRRNQIRNVGLIIVDEAHHAIRSNTYGKILEHYGAFGAECKCEGIGYCRSVEGFSPGDGQPCSGGAHLSWSENSASYCDTCDDSGLIGPKVLVAGFTATLIRGDKAKLSEVWQPGPIFKRDIHFGIRHGYLLDLKGRRVRVPELNLRDVKKSGGEYQDTSLADELERAFAPEIVAKAYVEHAGERLGIGFAPTVDSAEVFAAAFREQGITSEVIHGKLPKPERAAMLRRLESGATQVLWGCMVLTEGFDNPKISCVVMARPTTLPGLYQQCVGRALRPDLTLPPEDRGHALILDVVGAGEMHNLASLVDLSLPEPYEDEEEQEEWDCLLCLLPPADCRCAPEKEQKEPDDAPEDYYVGPVEVVDFDPLARNSSHAWQKTAGGTYVLTAGPDAYVFLVEEDMPGEYGIAWCTRDLSVYGFLGCGEDVPYFKVGQGCTCPGAPHVGVWGAWANSHRNLSMEMALAWGVDVAEELGGEAAAMLGDKKKAWRRSKDISDAQLNKARRLGIAVPMVEVGGVMVPDIRKGELSDLIDAAMAGKRVDPVRAALRAQARETVTV